MSKASREARRLARREARATNRADRRASRLARQKGRQGFLSGIIGDEGLGGLADDIFGGGDDMSNSADTSDYSAPGGKSGTGGSEDLMKMLPLLIGGLVLFMMMKKK